MGVNVAWVKVGTFSLSAAYAGIAGSVSVMVNHLADGTNPILYFQLSIEFLVAVVIGGSGTILGPAVGAMVLVFIQRQSETLVPDQPVLAPAILGTALILIVFVLPEGVVGGFKKLCGRLSQRVRAGPPAADPTRTAEPAVEPEAEPTADPLPELPTP
jgi:ABC-type branched-subunit amino acid transport system permease subunit